MSLLSELRDGNEGRLWPLLQTQLMCGEVTGDGSSLVFDVYGTDTPTVTRQVPSTSGRQPHWTRLTPTRSHAIGFLESLLLDFLTQLHSSTTALGSSSPPARGRTSSPTQEDASARELQHVGLVMRTRNRKTGLVARACDNANSSVTSASSFSHRSLDSSQRDRPCA